MTKPIVFNYQEYERMKDLAETLSAENEELKEKIEALTEINTELKLALWDQLETEDGTDQS
ncbi:MAG: hypothetical protein IKF75_01840 [Lachnospiraceae bacterium]|nr:hypothetical protein [Lachnospiraceae bacterium]